MELTEKQIAEILHADVKRFKKLSTKVPNCDQYLDPASQIIFTRIKDGRMEPGKILRITKGADNVTYVKDGETYKAGDFDFKVYNTFTDDSYEIKTGSLPNASSMVFEVFGKTESMLFMADMENKPYKKIYKKYGDELNADYVQAAHHGQNVNTDYYDDLDMKGVFVDAPAYLRQEDPNTHTAYEHLQYFTDRGVNIWTYNSTPNSIVLK